MSALWSALQNTLLPWLPKEVDRLLLVDAEGNPAASYPAAAPVQQSHPPCLTMITEALRWGEASFHCSDSGSFALAVPLTRNQQLTGGVILEFSPDLSEEPHAPARLRSLAKELTARLETSNFLNGPLLRENAARAGHQRIRAEAIHALKRGELQTLRSLYRDLEPELFLAMRKGQRTRARQLLNHLLTGIYSYGHEELHRVKGILLDSVALMTRSLAACGTDPESVLGPDFNLTAELHALSDHEQLSHWLRDLLERIMDGVASTPPSASDFRIQLACSFLHEHFADPLNRDQLARRVGLSPTHFSRLFRQSTGQSFSNYLNQLRCTEAARLLRQSSRKPLAIALDCGFQDQSYFTKVFQRFFATTPAAYRRTFLQQQPDSPGDL